MFLKSSLVRSVHLVSRRFYASETSGKLLVNLTVPHQVLIKDTVVNQVNLSSTDGDMGILANHVPTVAQLNPGVVEILGEKPQKFFVSGGFAIINPDSSLNINAVEAVPLEELDFDAAKRQLDQVKNTATSASGDSQVEAKIQLEVLEAVLAAQKQT